MSPPKPPTKPPTKSPAKPLTRIKDKALERSLSLAKFTLSSGARWAAQKMSAPFADEKKQSDKWNQFVTDQMSVLTRELGQLKGSLMKAGQMISVYGEHFLPPEANRLLKTLQSDSPPLEWSAIEPVLRAELGEKMHELKIDPTPFASASMGQVHRAQTLSGPQRNLALKIQYPGVESAIDNDLKVLKRVLTLSKILPGQFDVDPVLAELRDMLKQECNYHTEAQLTKAYQQLIGADPNYHVPQIYEDYSTAKVLATELIEGVRLDSPEVTELPLNSRGRLAKQFLRLYFDEIFKWGMVQTDPHFGNYLVEIDAHQQPKLALLDFGATRQFGESFGRPYRQMIGASIQQNRSDFFAAMNELGALTEDDPEDLKELFYDFCQTIVEPFHAEKSSMYFDLTGAYDFGRTDLPQRVMKQGFELKSKYKLRAPPRELIFLDRKMGGVFVVLSQLGIKLDAREILMEYLATES